jgi:hypothetical protein
MTIQITKPFAAYVAEEELPRTGDARKFAIHLPYEIEGAIKTGSWRWEWKYSGTQEQLDKNSGKDGLASLREQQLKAFHGHIEKQLHEEGERLYEVEGKRMLTRGPLKKG